MLPGHVGHGWASSDPEYWKKKKVIAEPTEALADISLDESNPERCIRVEVDLEGKIKEDLIQFLKKNIDVFT